MDKGDDDLDVSEIGVRGVAQACLSDKLFDDWQGYSHHGGEDTAKRNIR